MSYTKGPLEIENATEREGEPIYKVVRIEYGLKSVLATCYDMALCEEHGGTALGNAQLYRAAPQLLEALQDACLTYAVHGEQPPDKWIAALAAAQQGKE